jgi:hypothetical protein
MAFMVPWILFLGKRIPPGSLRLSVLSSQFSVLSSQFSVLSSQFSVLSSQFSVLSSQFSVLSESEIPRAQLVNLPNETILAVPWDFDLN